MNLVFRSSRMAASSHPATSSRPLWPEQTQSCPATCSPALTKRPAISAVDGAMWKTYRGMGSSGAMRSRATDRYGSGQAQGKHVAEGVEGRVRYAGPMSELISQIVGGLRSGMGYAGAGTLTTCAIALVSPASPVPVCAKAIPTTSPSSETSRFRSTVDGIPAPSRETVSAERSGFPEEMMSASIDLVIVGLGYVGLPS